MSVNNIIAVLLLACITDITTGFPYRKIEHSPGRRSWNAHLSPSASATQNENHQERSRNEFEIIEEARKSRRNYNPNASPVHTRGLSRPSRPLASPVTRANSRAERYELPSTRHEFSGLSRMSSQVASANSGAERYELPSTRDEFSDFSRNLSPALSPERRVIVNQVFEPWQKAPALYAQKVSFHPPDEPEYLY